jgi:glycerol-1-phosphate dehydrogenase [NAD(P)+]
MNEQRIRDALKQATDTAEILIGDDVLGEAPRLFGAAFGDRDAVIVADENTLEVAGAAVRAAMQAAGRTPLAPYVFDGRPTLHADYENIEALVGSLSEHQAIPIAVGSGTVNDIVKRAAHECDRPYMNVATAASMDGYTAFGAAITKQGYKQTMSCPAPRAVLADLRILLQAPAKMTSAGYADLLAKITAGADWIVADALEVEPIDCRAWSLVQGSLRQATARPAQLSAGEPAAMEELIEGLVMSGLAMQAASSSRPASGAEHQFSHLWEMEGLGQDPADGSPPLSHGFKVGLGTVSIAALYEVVLERDLGGLDVAAAVDRWPSWEQVQRRVRAAHTTPGLADAAVEETRAKYLEPAELRERLKLLNERWPSLCERLREQLMGADELRALLRAAACPTTPDEIGLGPERLRDTYRRAQMIRRRFTVLDLLDQTGILEECALSLFAPGAFWAPQPTGAMLPGAG